MKDFNEEGVDNPLVYSVDSAILMHRDAHFSGSFPLMIEYYQNEGRGVVGEFNLHRIQELYEIEQKEGTNLAAMLLSGTEMEKIADAKKLYKQLRDLFEGDKDPKSVPLLIAALILAENEDLEQAIKDVVEKKEGIVPALISLLKNEDFHDSLFPGYGQGPELAAQCLGLIGDKRAIISLFEGIGSEDFFSEEVCLQALKSIGEPAKKFLLQVLHGKPLNADNEHAALALGEFKEDQEVASACLAMLKDLDLKKYPFLGSYLILVCEGLKSPEQQKELIDLAERETTPKSLRDEIKLIAKGF